MYGNQNKKLKNKLFEIIRVRSGISALVVAKV